MTSRSWRRVPFWRQEAPRRSRLTSACVRPIWDGPKTKTTSRRRRMLSLRDVHVHIGKLHILQGVNLEIKPGESAALLGRNGVGKTTTLRAIMGLASKSSGVIKFDQ